MYYVAFCTQNILHVPKPVKMSNFKQTLNELYITGFFTDRFSATSLANEYDKSGPEKKAALDKHALLTIEKFAAHNKNHRDNIRSIKNNLQFFFWYFIISSVFFLIYIFVN